MPRSVPLLLLSLFLTYAAVMPNSATADEPVTLIGTIVKWRYPDAKIGKSQMSDAATINAEGNRTVPSTVLKTTLTTADSVENVIALYRELLTRNPENDRQLGIPAEMGRSVVFHDESAGRPFAFHTILVNSDKRSTTLVITRGENEDTTRISWTQYVK